jgi:uncharacterized RDD family membrane protein YckC
VALEAPAPLAALWRRFVAFFLDGLILAPVYVLYAVVLDATFGVLVEADPGGAGVVVVAVDPLRVALELGLTLVTDAAYYAGCWTRWGATPGQRIFGVAVRVAAPSVSGGPPGLAGRPSSPAPSMPRPPSADGRVPAPVATTRWAILQLLPHCAASLAGAGALSIGVVAGINTGWYLFLFLTTAVDPLRRGFHDRRAGTVVVGRARRRSA